MLTAFAITVVSEAVVILAIQRPKNIWFWLVGIMLIHCLTHPLTIYAIHVQGLSYFLVEFWVLVVEAIWYFVVFKLTWRKAFVLSLCANIASILVGMIVRF